MCCVKKVAAGARVEGCECPAGMRSVGDVGAGEKLDVEESFAAKCNNTTHSRGLHEVQTCGEDEATTKLGVVIRAQ